MNAPLPLVFDFGMYDGEDARYYLETGHKVIAVEANPALCAMAAKRLARYVATG